MENHNFVVAKKWRWLAFQSVAKILELFILFYFILFFIPNGRMHGDFFLFVIGKKLRHNPSTPGIYRKCQKID